MAFSIRNGLVKPMRRCLSWLLLFPSFVIASQDVIDQAVWSVAQNAQDLTFNAGTRQGEFASCELVFSYPYRDYRAYKGAPLIVRGSVSSNLLSNRPFNYLLKVVPIRLTFDTKTKKFDHVVLAPAVASMKVNGQSMAPYLIQTFKCEDKGLCVGYSGKPADAGLSLMQASLDAMPFDAQIFFSASKNGFDESFRLSDLKPENPKKSNEQLRFEFSQCLLGLVDKQMESMK